LVEEALRQARCEREEIETIAVGLGPGSYTGIRGAIALAQGWQLGRGVNVIGLSSVECLAAGAEQEKYTVRSTLLLMRNARSFIWRATNSARARGVKWKDCGWPRSFEIVALAERGERLLGPGAAEYFRPRKTSIQTRRFWDVWQLIGATLCPAKSWNRFTCGKPPSKRRRLHERSSYFRGRLAE
jgi:tRNA threonylcarbamoyl adenosine modification protein YeaZ